MNEIYKTEKNILDETARLHESKNAAKAKAQVVYSVIYGLFSLWKRVHIKIPVILEQEAVATFHHHSKLLKTLFSDCIGRFQRLDRPISISDFPEPPERPKEAVQNPLNIRVQ